MRHAYPDPPFVIRHKSEYFNPYALRIQDHDDNSIVTWKFSI